MSLRSFDFQCARCGTFELWGSFDPNDEEGRKRFWLAQPCPKCGESAPGVWLRSPAMRKPGYEAIRFAGNDIPVESVERALSQPEPDDDAGFWDDKDFGAEFVDALDRNTGRWHAGELPPVELTAQELTTLKEGVAKG